MFKMNILLMKTKIKMLASSVTMHKICNKNLKYVLAVILNLHKNEVVFAVLLQMRREKNDAIVFLLINIKMKLFFDSMELLLLRQS